MANLTIVVDDSASYTLSDAMGIMRQLGAL